MNEWLATNYFTIGSEPNYKPLKGRIIIEKLLEDPSNDLKDFKLYCYKGEPKFILVCSGRFSNMKCDFYSLDWQKLPANLEKYDVSPEPMPRPDALEDMIKVSRALSRDFPFVRVDLYYTGGKIYFGELTFTPVGGNHPYVPIEYDFLFGEDLDISLYA